MSNGHLLLGRNQVHQFLVFIGDVHGCDAELSALLEYLENKGSLPTPVGPRSGQRTNLVVGENTTLVFLGDLVHKGDKSVEVLRRVRALAGEAVSGTFSALSLQGNHEVEALRAFRRTHHYANPSKRDAWLRKGGGRREVQEALENDPDLVSWLESLPLVISFDWKGFSASALHAGIVPEPGLAPTRLTVRSVSPAADEETPKPDGQLAFDLVELREVWVDAETGTSQAATKQEVEKAHEDPAQRVRRRSLDNSTTSRSPVLRLEDLKPWGAVFNGTVEIPLPANTSQSVELVLGVRHRHLLLFGHYGKALFQNHPFAIGLDTNCNGGGYLTALVVDADRSESTGDVDGARPLYYVQVEAEEDYGLKTVGVASGEGKSKKIKKQIKMLKKAIQKLKKKKEKARIRIDQISSGENVVVVRSRAAEEKNAVERLEVELEELQGSMKGKDSESGSESEEADEF